MNGNLVAYFPAPDRKNYITNRLADMWITTPAKSSFNQDEPPLGVQAPDVR